MARHYTGLTVDAFLKFMHEDQLFLRADVSRILGENHHDLLDTTIDLWAFIKKVSPLYTSYMVHVHYQWHETSRINLWSHNPVSIDINATNDFTRWKTEMETEIRKWHILFPGWARSRLPIAATRNGKSSMSPATTLLMVHYGHLQENLAATIRGKHPHSLQLKVIYARLDSFLKSQTKHWIPASYRE
jgi:hypothetical protein